MGKAKKYDLTAELLRMRVHYAPETGVFTNRITGEPMGACTSDGYIQMYVLGRSYRGHRLAWLYVTGDWPSAQVDHIDGDRANNQFSNLRNATWHQNSFNSVARVPSKSGLPRGVSRLPRSPNFLASLKYKGKRIKFGAFKTPELASEFYQLAAEMLHGQFAFHLGAGAKCPAPPQGATKGATT